MGELVFNMVNTTLSRCPEGKGQTESVRERRKVVCSRRNLSALEAQSFSVCAGSTARSVAYKLLLPHTHKHTYTLAHKEWHVVTNTPATLLCGT